MERVSFGVLTVDKPVECTAASYSNRLSSRATVCPVPSYPAVGEFNPIRGDKRWRCIRKLGDLHEQKKMLSMNVSRTHTNH